MKKRNKNSEGSFTLKQGATILGSFFGMCTVVLWAASQSVLVDSSTKSLQSPTAAQLFGTNLYNSNNTWGGTNTFSTNVVIGAATFQTGDEDSSGFVPGSAGEVLIRKSVGAGNVLALQNDLSESNGFSSIAFRKATGFECMAVGYGQASPFNGDTYIETWATNTPPQFSIFQDGDYGTVGSGFRYYRRSTFANNGNIIFWKHIPTASTQQNGVQINYNGNIFVGTIAGTAYLNIGNADANNYQGIVIGGRDSAGARHAVLGLTAPGISTVFVGNDEGPLTIGTDSASTHPIVFKTGMSNASSDPLSTGTTRFTISSTALTAAVAITPSAGITGTTTNDSAAAGIVGEVVTSAVAVGNAVSLTTATAANVTSISLTAGDWDVEGNINFSGTGATMTATVGGITSTSATIPTDGTEVQSGILGVAITTIDGVTLPRKRFSLSGTTTVYLVGRCTFTAGTEVAYGAITARRVR